MSIEPAWRKPAQARPTASQAAVGRTATAARQPLTPSMHTRLCVRRRPGHLRSPYTNEPAAELTASPASSGPDMPTDISRCSRSAGSTSSARASSDRPAAPVTYTGQARARMRSIGSPSRSDSSAFQPAGSSQSPATESPIRTAARSSGRPGATPSARPVTAAGAIAHMPKTRTDSADMACATARSGTRLLRIARSPPGAAPGAPPATNAQAASTTAGASGSAPSAAKPTAPTPRPTASCGRARSGRIRMPRSAAPTISPITYTAARIAPSAYPPSRSRTRNTTARGAMATGIRAPTATTAQVRVPRDAISR
ncbi:hypothetical protein SMD44_03712 [Streptomyces alboflavus]|uniref:Uncharacterized protein n=1 Tax=Streptomyces alboflavus TaxID=67267 RepID=A0A1Z1WCV6_9ACTN|nr:hypothetical protein SMD44_03712 [Streptomyces alboflavus]